MLVRHTSAPADRNKGPILEVLRRVFPSEGLVLEVAAGTGQHAVYFAEHLPGLTWQPTDPDRRSRFSITAWIDHAGVGNVRPPLHLDTREPWPVASADALLAVNMVHISPWSATLALLDGAARVLPPGGPLVLYGPYKLDGAHTSEGNAAFDAALRAQDPAWGIRDLADLEAAAAAAGLTFAERVAMPANNQCLVFRR